MHPSLRELDRINADGGSAEARTHLLSCAECRELALRLRAVDRWLAFLPREPLPADVQQRVRAAALRYLRERRLWTRATWLAAVGVAAGSALSAFSGGAGVEAIRKWFTGRTPTFLAEGLTGFSAAPGDTTWHLVSGVWMEGQGVTSAGGGWLALGMVVAAVSAVVCAAGLLHIELLAPRERPA